MAAINAVVVGCVGSVALVGVTWLGQGSRVIPEPWASRQWLIDARERFGPMVDGPVWMLMILGLLLGAWAALSRPGVSSWARRAAAVAWVLPLLWALPWGSGDIYNYAEQGWAFAHGYHPSIVPAGTAPSPYADWVGAWQGTTVAYPPLALMLSAASTMFGSGSELDAIQAQRTWPVLGLVGLWWSVGVLADRLGIERSRARWLGLMNPVILLHGVAGGHHDVMAVALVVAGMATWVRTQRRPVWVRALFAGALIVSSGLVKPTVLLALAVLPLMRESSTTAAWLKRLACAAGLVVGAVGVSVLVSGALPGGWAWLSATGVPAEGSRTLLRDLQWMATHDRFISSGGNPLTTWFLANLGWMVIVLPLVVTASLVLRQPRGGAVEVLTRIWFAILVFGPTGWPWYALGFVPLVGLITRARHTILAVTAVVTVWAVPVGVPPTVADLPTFILYWVPVVVVGTLSILLVTPEQDTSCSVPSIG